MKAAIYIEQTIKRGPQAGKVIGWGGYIYATEEVNASDYTFEKTGTDQWGNEVSIYKAKEATYLETPGGVKKTDRVILFTNQPAAKIAA